MRPDGVIPVVLAGLGETGRAIARAVVLRDDLEIVAAVDPDAALAGQPLDELVGAPAPELRVESDLAEALARAKGGVLLHSGTSRLEEALPDLRAAVRAGVHVVSTCEELVNPALDSAEDAEALDRLCEQRGVAVVATGVAPGFVLDRLPAFLSQVAGPVRHVRVIRVVDVTAGSGALRQKAGLGLAEDAFDEALERGEIGQPGLAQSAALLAESCAGADEYEVDEEIVPLLAEEDGAVGRGEVAGVQQVARVFAEDREVVRLELVLQAGAEDPRDEVELDADPPLRLIIPGGVPGEVGTAHAVVNAIPAVLERQGLLTVLDLPAGR
ncbi:MULTISPECIES: dihydrodipicolinate reductase [Anaeromyxobacter]|uniref:dihydrodipicolinate reductase n=1 Tax=Anaeromyxobacter TaxID=161492 RepID=UPI001F5902A0|nr:MULTISPECIES: dihydrodipicolinate reductase [unclassified Anaeromyxobacter]